MSWTSYYSAVGGAGRLSRLLKETKQRLLLNDAVLTDLPDPEQISLSRSYASLSGNRDSLSRGISRNVNDVWKLPLEPYNKMRLWLKFECGLSPKDWSYSGQGTPIKTWIKSSGKAQPIKRTVQDDGITEGQVYNIFDGLTQWVEVEDREEIRLSDMLMSNNDVNISVFLSPFSGVTYDEEGYADLFYKVDTDEVQYAYRARLKADGSIRFTIVDNYAVSEVTTDPGVVDLWDTGDFDIEDFDNEDFDTSGQAYQTDPDIAPRNWKILSFSYNIITRQMRVWSAMQNPDDSNDITITQHTVTTHPQDITNLSMQLPMNEGNLTVLHDASGQGNPGTFATPAANAPTWDNGLLKFSGNSQQVTIPNSAELNTFTSFTVAFKLKLTSYAQDAGIDVIFSKGFAGSTPNGGFTFYMDGSASKTLNVLFRNNSGTGRTLSLPNGIPSLDTWYDVIASYDGTTYTFQVVGPSSPSPATLTAAGDTFTSSAVFEIGDNSFSFQGYISDLQIYKGRAWDADDLAYFADVVPGYKGGFPMYQPIPPPPPEDPVPIIRPLNKIYNVTVPTTTGQIQLNNPSATSPFTSFYSVGGGTASTDPELLKYNAADGTITTETVGFTAGYSLTGQNSWADVVWDDGDRGYGQTVRTTGSWINGKRLGKITIGGLYRSSDANGQIQLGIIKANGSFIAFGDEIEVSILSSSSSSPSTKSGENAANAHPDTGYPCAVGDGVGFKWTGGSDGTIWVQRGGSNVYESTSLSCQATLDTSSDWNITNSSYGMAGVFYTGGYTTGNPAYFLMGSTNSIVANLQVNSTLEGIIATHVKWRARRVGSAASATLVCRIRSNTGAILYTFPQTISFNTIGTTTQDLEFLDVNQPNIAWADNYKITLEFAVETGINDSSVYLEVNFNPGTGSGVVGGTTIKAQYSTNGTSYSNVSPVADWAGQIYTGGKSFTPWIALNGAKTRAGTLIKSNTPSPPNAKAFGRKITKVTVRLRKFGAPIGLVKLKIYNGLTPKALGFNNLDATSLTTSEVAYDFTWVFNAYVCALNDYIFVEYLDGTVDNYVEVMINTDAAAGAAGDGQKMIAADYNGTVWTERTEWDLAAVMYEGGIPDLTSRNRVSTMVVTDASKLKGEKITEVTFYYKKTVGSTLTGNVEVWSRRGSDDTQGDLLGTFDANSISTTTWTPKQLINRNALKYLGVSDKISIEYSGGNSTNGILVMLKLSDTFDANETMYSEYDSVQWSAPIDNKEVVGEMWTGGDTYTPDPGTPFEVSPDAYNHNLFILAGGGINSTTGVPLTMAGMRIRDFRLLSGQVYGSGELTNLIKNKHTILDTLVGQTALAGYTTLTGS